MPDPPAPVPPSDPRGRSSDPPVPPLDPPMVPFALGGTVIWALVGLLVLVTDAPAGWRWICLAGFLIGCGLLILMVPRDRRHRRVDSAAS